MAAPLFTIPSAWASPRSTLTTEDDSVLVTIITDGEENCNEGMIWRWSKNLIRETEEAELDLYFHRHRRSWCGEHCSWYGHRQSSQFSEDDGWHQGDVLEKQEPATMEVPLRWIARWIQQFLGEIKEVSISRDTCKRQLNYNIGVCHKAMAPFCFNQMEYWKVSVFYLLYYGCFLSNCHIIAGAL